MFKAAGWLMVGCVMALGCAAPAVDDEAPGATESAISAGRYQIATCKAGSVETFDSLQLVATVEEGQVTSLESDATDYRGRLEFRVDSVRFLPQHGSRQTIAFGRGTLGQTRRATTFAVETIILDPARRSVVLVSPSDGGAPQTHSSCTFNNLGLF